MKAIFDSVTSANNQNRIAAAEIKANIMTLLQHTVRQICASNSPEFGDDGKADLCAVIEAMFINGLKDGFMNRVRRNLGELNPEYNLSFWNLLMEISHQENIKAVENLRIIRTEVGQCRAWIRVALNEALLSSYLKTIRENRRAVLRYYNNYAYLLDAEALDIAQTLIQRVELMSLELPCNSGILNTWSDVPLSLAGIACKPMRMNTVSTGVDIAQMLTADSSANSKSASVASSLVSSSSGIGQIVNFSGDEALKLILKAHSDREETASLHAADEATLPIPVPDSVPGERLTGKIEQVQSNSLGNSLKDQSSWSYEDDIKNSVETEAVPQEETPRVMERSYSSLIESNILNNTQIRTPNFRNVLHSLLGESDAQNQQSSEHGIIDNDVGILSRNEPAVLSSSPDVALSDLLTTLTTEKGLDSQDYKCKSCNDELRIANIPKACAYSGLYFCDKCMANEEVSIPARIVFNWDFRKYAVSQKSLAYLNEINKNPIIDFKSCNPYIYTVVEDMAVLQTLRNQLNYIRAYLYTCREPIIEELQNRMKPREYMYEHIHQYSISDLLEVKDGTLAGKLQEVVDFGKNHVARCWLCLQKGFICELCDDSKPLFPFETASVFRCNSCSGVYHNTCLNALKPCPKCKRKEERDVPLMDET